MSQVATTVRAAFADLPAELRAKLERIADGEAVEAHHGYRAGPWLKLIGVVLGLALTTGTVVLAGRFWGLSSSRPLDPVAVGALGAPATLGFLLVLRNLRRLLLDPGLGLSRWAFVTPSLVLRVEPGGASVLVDRLASFTPAEAGKASIRARQLEGDVSFYSGGERVRLKGFESVTAMVEFSAAIAAGVEHVRARGDDSEDRWLDRIEPSRAPPLPSRLAVGLALLVLSLLLGGAAVTLAHLADLKTTSPDYLHSRLIVPDLPPLVAHAATDVPSSVTVITRPKTPVCLIWPPAAGQAEAHFLIPLTSVELVSLALPFHTVDHLPSRVTQPAVWSRVTT